MKRKSSIFGAATCFIFMAAICGANTGGGGSVPTDIKAVFNKPL
jgi:hypothetical protein